MHKGTKIQVFGEIQTGSDPVSASYSIDNGTPTTNSEEGVDQTTELVSQTLYSSPNLPFGNHELNLTVLNTGKNRQYKPWYFAVYNSTAPSPTSSASPSSTSTNTDVSNNSGQSSSGGHTDVAAIVAGVLAGVLFVALIIFGVLFFRRRRKVVRGTLSTLRSVQSFSAQVRGTDVDLSSDNTLSPFQQTPQGSDPYFGSSHALPVTRERVLARPLHAGAEEVFTPGAASLPPYSVLEYSYTSSYGHTQQDGSDLYNPHSHPAPVVVSAVDRKRQLAMR